MTGQIYELARLLAGDVVSQAPLHAACSGGAHDDLSLPTIYRRILCGE